MGIQDQIYEDFFKKLRKDRKFPKIIVDQLELCWNEKKRYTKATLLKIIKEGADCGSKN